MELAVYEGGAQGLWILSGLDIVDNKSCFHDAFLNSYQWDLDWTHQTFKRNHTRRSIVPLLFYHYGRGPR